MMMNLYLAILRLLGGLLLVACAQYEIVEAEYQLENQPNKQTEGGLIYYIRTDGADLIQCTGLVDAPYSGSGIGQDCAWDHSFRALPPGDSASIVGGDSVVIAAGKYRMGLSAPGADNPDVCSPDYPWDCSMSPIPSGPDNNSPTRILGVRWNDGCSHPPELWGTERVAQILNLRGSSNIEIACLELTDHESCAQDHTGGMACERDRNPYGDWAVVGLFAEDSNNVTLKYLNIQGLAVHGVWVGRLSDWTVEHERIAAYGWSGWGDDIDGEDHYTAEMIFRHWTEEWVR